MAASKPAEGVLKISIIVQVLLVGKSYSVSSMMDYGFVLVTRVVYREQEEILWQRDSVLTLQVFLAPSRISQEIADHNGIG